MASENALSYMGKEGRNNISGSIGTIGQKLFGFIRSKVASREDAEDLLQDVWYRFSQLSNLDELENVSAWLYRVARNRIADFYRKRKEASIEDFSYLNEDGEWNLREILMADETAHPDMVQFKNIFWDELMSALQELPAKQREVYILNELEEMTLQEIADLQGENLKTIISRKGYAVKYLRIRMGALYNEFIST